MNSTNDCTAAAPADRTMISCRREPVHPILKAIIVVSGTILGFVLAVFIGLLTGIIRFVC